MVLLRDGERKTLQRLAREQNVSSSEIVRRSILAYEVTPEPAREDVTSLLAEMNGALDRALEAVRSARTQVAENISIMRKLRAEGA